ncbi:hypothetical protein K432DRAFT_293062 [Lepidopterella palustris CBS 459.81]|uniref:AIG1-type G domain-containing protein n=1 Tax=Lepidopterella palustris CBS 459.81 TaxID=1314670 RepID=A0A8E2EEL6_9PEZI|nr:hypothetical protein K432DRAFT_293062 [Lepidopterella palustris CBS 459.81]
MDTPGFDADKETDAFLEIVRGIQAVRPFARITGVLYLTCINQSRFDDFDRKLLAFIRSLTGEEHIARITFVTTFWTAAGEKQKATFNKQLDLLRSKWQGAMGQQPTLYKHGREYNTEGADTGRFLDWFENRGRIAEHGKRMLARNYGSTIVPESGVGDFRIVQELNEDTPIHLTDAGRLLRLPQASASVDPETNSKRPGKDPSPLNSTPDGDPKREPEPSKTTAPQATGPSLLDTIFNGLATIVRNVDFSVNVGGANMAHAPGAAQPFRPTMPYTGPVDRLSAVDVMKKNGLDSSFAGRMDYAARNNINIGNPGSRERNDAIRRHVERRFG